MKAKQMIFAMVLAMPSVANAWPGAGPGSNLDYAARDLNSSVQNLTYVLGYTSANSPTYQDSVTLGYATEHFQEEVELGPEDLNVDFDTIENTFNELHARFMQCREFGAFPQVRDALFRVEEANIHLREVWTGAPTGPQGPGGGDHGGPWGGDHRGPWGGDHRGPWGGDGDHRGPWGGDHRGPWGGDRGGRP